MSQTPPPGYGPERFLEPDPVTLALRAELDLTLLEENLKRTPEERVRRMMEAVRMVELLRQGLVK